MRQPVSRIRAAVAHVVLFAGTAGAAAAAADEEEPDNAFFASARAAI